MAKSRAIPVFDGHNDTLLHLALKAPGSEGDFLTGRDGHIDLPKARAGGLAGGLFAMFVPSTKWAKEIRWREQGPNGPKISRGWDVPIAGRVAQPGALNSVMAMMASLFRLQKLSQGQVKVVTTHRQLTSAMDRGVLAAVMHMEGVEAIRTDLDALGVLYEAGLRSLGPVWSRPNAFGYGVPFNFPDSPDIGPGLTAAGKELVKLCNELGILVDLSHLNEMGFWDVVAVSNAPIVASHSGAWSLCRSPRNLTDEQLRAVGDSGGIVGVNFARGFLRKDGQGDKPTSVREIAKHVEYIADKIGVDHVGFGSDFDGTQ
ncbi:MAG: dipeptidase, partial [Longimicrobiales bacterium]|nr:dipeptidase [Longimicrobiales bacterium]